MTTTATPIQPTTTASSRPWYCQEAVHGVVKRHTNVDGTVIYFTQETPCDCLPPVLLPRPPSSSARRLPRSGEEAQSMAAVRRRYRLPTSPVVCRLTSKSPYGPLPARQVQAGGATCFRPSPPRGAQYAHPLSPQQTIVVSPCEARCSPLQQEPSISVVAPVVFPSAADTASRPIAVPPMTMPTAVGLNEALARTAGTTTTAATASGGCGVSQHGHYQSFGFAFCPECGVGLLPAGTMPQYTWTTCPAPHTRTRPATAASSPTEVAMNNSSASPSACIRVLAVNSPDDTQSQMQFCLLCGAPITYTTANASQAPPAATANVTGGLPPLGTTPPSTVLGASHAAYATSVSAPILPPPSLPTSCTPVAPLGRPPGTPPPPAGPSSVGVDASALPSVPAPGLFLSTPMDKPSAPPPDAGAATVPPIPTGLHGAAAQPHMAPQDPPTPPPFHLNTPVESDWQTRHDMQSVDAVLAAMLQRAQSGHHAAHNSSANACGLPGCPLCLSSAQDTSGVQNKQCNLPDKDKAWWCGSPAVMIIHNHYYSGR